MNYRIYSLSENSLVVQLPPEISESQIRFLFQLKSAINKLNWRAIVEVMVTFHELSILFDITAIDKDELKEEVVRMIEDQSGELSEDAVDCREIFIPVCYEEEMALDKDRLVRKTGLSFSDIVELHQNSSYLVYMMGFLPGFMYLGGLNQKLFCPRLEVPRPKIEVGSIGIADDQTGIYPMESPGGWNILGRTPLTLFQYHQSRGTRNGATPSPDAHFVRPLDIIKFTPITRQQYNELQNVSIGEFQLIHSKA